MRASAGASGEPDVHGHDSPGEAASGAREEADLGEAKRDRDVAVDRQRVGVASVGVDATGQVERDDLHGRRSVARGAQASEDSRRDALDGVFERLRTGAEQSIDHQRGAREQSFELRVVVVLAGRERWDLRLDNRAILGVVVAPGLGQVDENGATPLGEVGRGDQGVATIVAAAGQHEDRTAFGRAERHPCFLGRGQPGGRHQLALARPGLDGRSLEGAHLVRSDELAHRFTRS